MNAESSRLRSTGVITTDMRAIWPGALVVVYLAMTGVVLLAGATPAPARAIATHFGVLALVAAATFAPRSPVWLRAGSPLLALFFLYSGIPSIITAAGHVDVRDSIVVGWEAALFGTQPALAWARAVPSLWISEPLHLAYLSYYPIIFSVPVALLLSRRPDDFSHAVLVLMLTFVACFVLFIVFPVAGPRYFWESSAPTGPMRTIATWLLESGSSRGTAFPSSHVAVSVTQSILAIHYFGKRGIIVAVLTTGLAAGAVYGGFHYLIDVIAGAALGTALTLPGVGMRRRAR